jgi:hypothetical protein
MAMYPVQVLNPKAVKLLEDLADMGVIRLEPKTAVTPKQPITGEELAAARTIVMRGAPTLDVDKMIAWLNGSKEYSKLPFRE